MDHKNTTQPIHDVLAACGAKDIVQQDSRHWKLSFRNGKTFSALASADEDWLELRVKTNSSGRRRCAPARLWHCLRCNGDLPGGAKFALRPHDLRPRICAELPLEEGTCPPQVLQQTGQGLRLAIDRLRERRKASQLPLLIDESAGMTECNEPQCDLGELCEAAGWKFARRASGDLAVELEAPGGSVAILTQSGCQVTATVCFAASERPAVASTRHAAALMLLTASGLVRMIRAVVTDDQGRITLSYQVRMQSPTTERLARALSALSVVCRLCGKQEIEAIQDQAIADRYLAVRGWAS